MKIRKQKAVAWILVLVFLLEDPAVVRAYGFQDGKLQELSEDKKKYPTDITKTDHLFEYRITYELNGGQNSGKNAESYRMEDLPLTLESPRRVGYNFAGWYADNYFEKKVTTIEQGMVGNMVLYANQKDQRCRKYQQVFLSYGCETWQRHQDTKRLQL